MEKADKSPEFGRLIRLQIPSQARYLPLVRHWVESSCLLNGFSTSVSNDLKWVAGEAIANVIKHAYLGREGHPVFFEIKFEPDRATFRIKDFGTKTLPSQWKKSDLKDYRTKGIGLYLIQHLTDSFVLGDLEGPGNQMVFIKKKV